MIADSILAVYSPFISYISLLMRVRVYRPARSAAQSGSGAFARWVVEPECVSPRLPEPIMGWASARDPYSCLRGRLRFVNEKDALAFVRGKGWEVLAMGVAEKQGAPHSYLERFRVVRPEDEERRVRG